MQFQLEKEWRDRLEEGEHRWRLSTLLPFRIMVLFERILKYVREIHYLVETLLMVSAMTDVDIRTIIPSTTVMTIRLVDDNPVKKILNRVVM